MQGALFAAEGRGWLRSEVFRAMLGDHLVDCLPSGWTLDRWERQAHRGALLIRGCDGYIQARMQRVQATGRFLRLDQIAGEASTTMGV